MRGGQLRLRRDHLRCQAPRQCDVLRIAAVLAHARAIGATEPEQRTRLVRRLLQALPVQRDRAFIVVALADAGVVLGALQQRRRRRFR